MEFTRSFEEDRAEVGNIIYLTNELKIYSLFLFVVIMGLYKKAMLATYITRNVKKD